MERAEIKAAPLLHPFNAVIFAFPLALFPSALLADVTYLNSAEMQWSNFAAWLLAGATAFSGILLIWAVISLFVRGRRGRATIYTLLVAIMFAAGLVNSFNHSQDGWSSVGSLGLALSVLASIAALIAGLIAHSRGRVAA